MKADYFQIVVMCVHEQDEVAQWMGEYIHEWMNE